jgi:hypothetical protein
LVSEIEKKVKMHTELQDKKIESQKTEMEIYVQSLHRVIEGFAERMNEFQSLLRPKVIGGLT